MPRHHPARLLATAASLVVIATAAAAQGASQGASPSGARDTLAVTRRDTADGGASHGSRAAGARLSGVAATGGLILLGAAGAQTLRTPTAWPRTPGGFGRRAADQTGFYLAQTGVQRVLAAASGWHPDEAPCRRRAVLPLAGCAIVRTVTAVDRRGVRRAHLPFLASVGAATALSVTWRPERRSADQAGAFVATRLAVVLAGFAGERLLAEWRHRHDGAR